MPCTLPPSCLCLLFPLLSRMFFLAFHLRIPYLSRPSLDAPSSWKSSRVSSLGILHNTVELPQNASQKKIHLYKAQGHIVVRLTKWCWGQGSLMRRMNHNPGVLNAPVQLSQTLLDPEVHHQKFYCLPFVSLVLPAGQDTSFWSWLLMFLGPSWQGQCWGRRSYPHLLCISPYPKFVTVLGA